MSHDATIAISLAIFPETASWEIILHAEDEEDEAEEVEVEAEKIVEVEATLMAVPTLLEEQADRHTEVFAAVHVEAHEEAHKEDPTTVT